MYVLDASVVLKWYLQEKDTTAALGFRQKYISGSFNLVFPDLILYELANALRYNKSFPQSSVFEAIASFIDLGTDIIVPTTSIVHKALEISYKENITFYDAAYIALSSEIGYCFVTADEKLFKKVSNLQFIKLLSKF